MESPVVDELINEQNEAGEGVSEHAASQAATPEPANEEQIASSVPLSPPEDCEAVTSDRGVLKKVLEPGEPGTTPTLHARCLGETLAFGGSNVGSSVACAAH